VFLAPIACYYILSDLSSVASVIADADRPQNAMISLSIDLMLHKRLYDVVIEKKGKREERACCISS